MSTTMVRAQDVQRKCYVLDAAGKPLGKTAALAADLLRGKRKVDYTPHVDGGDFVIIVNCKDAVLTGNKLTQKFYRTHSGYAGGLKAENYAQTVVRKPTYPMEHAIKGMLPKGPLGRKLFTYVKVYADAKHPHAAQQPITVEI